MTGVTPDEQKFARCSLYVLSMACLTVQAAEPLTSLDKPEGRLDIIAWPGYIERGQTDKQYDWVTQFEKRPGVRLMSKPPLPLTRWSA